MAAPVYQSFYGQLPVSAQDFVISAAGWVSYRNRFGVPFQRALRELQRTDEYNADDVRADQERRLRRMVCWAAKTVPYYRDLFRREGIDPASIRSIEDLPRIPTLDRETVRLQTEALRSEGVSRRRIVPGHSSGSTGTALRLFHTRQALGWEYAVIWRQRAWFRVKLGERFAAFGGQQVVPLGQSGPPFWRYDRPRARMLFSLYHLTPENLPVYVNELQSGYSFWQGYPSSIGLIAQNMLDRGVELGDAAPRVIFTSSETLLDFHLSKIARSTGARVADRYGNSEFSASALQCPEGSYHVDTEFCVLEIDPEEETDDWVRGEVIATGFANRAMPFIRYRTGDVATLRKRGSCACGRERPILEEIDGRIDDFVITPDGRRVGRMDHVFKNAMEVKEAQIYQPSTDRIVVRFVPRAGFGVRAQADLDREFRARLGNEIDIVYERVERIPRRENRKFRAVVSDLEAGRLHDS